MEAATSTLQHSFSFGPRGPNPPHGAQQTQGPPHQPAPGPSGAPHPEEQQHQKPFFYIQPSQPYLPMQSLQWPVPVPMPVSYNPYYGYPGLGYGMPVMPQYQANPYMEPPGFIVPHTHLHLMDYRRLLNPQYYQTMAYHSRRFRYQHNSSPREMTSCEVQTEPLSAAPRTSTPSSSDAPSVLVCSTDTTTGVPPQLVQKGDQSLELKDPTPSATTRTSSNGSFVIQTEEVRIECCTTPVGLQLLHEAAEMSHNFSKDVVQCGSILQSRVLKDDGPNLPADQSDQALQVCPNILLVGTPGANDKTPADEELNNQMDPVNANLEPQEATGGESEETEIEKDVNVDCDVVHLPFDQNYVDEQRKMESTAWSMEETLIPSPESMIQNGSTDPQDETLTGVGEATSTEMLMLREEAPTEEIVSVIEMPPMAEDEVEELLPTVEEMASEVDICPVMDDTVSENAHVVEVIRSAEVDVAPNLLLLDISPFKVDRTQHRREVNVQDHQDTSFESLPSYLPSTSLLSDFDNVFYCSKMPPAPKKQNRPLNNQSIDVPTRRRRKLHLEYKEQPNIRKPKEKYKPKGKADRRSLSDHECCLNRSFNENIFSDYVSKRERLCSRCLAKQRICTSAGPGLEGRSLKRKAAPFQQWNDVLLPTCDACKSHTKRRLMRKGSNPDVRGYHYGHDTDGESSENSCCRTEPKWRPADPRNLTDVKRPLASKQNQEKYPPATYPKLREKNYSCNELQHQSVARERLRHCPHGNSVREMDENCTVPFSHQDKWRNVDHMFLPHRWQTAEKSWMGLIPNINTEGPKNGARSQLTNMHKKSQPQPQSQGTCRKDTRC